jgi:hypothetical protein
VFATIPYRLLRFGFAATVLLCAVVLLSPLSMRSAYLTDKPLIDVVAFYGVTAGAYALLPFMRRGDIAIVAIWLVLGVGITPCFSGEELSPPHMFGGLAGVVLAVAPIYIARFRQVAQGDVRLHRRREGEVEA